MILDYLKETKEDHDSNHHILDAKMDKCIDGMQGISTALETINEVKEHTKVQDEMLKDIRNETKFMSEQMQKCKGGTTKLWDNWQLDNHSLKYFG